MSKTTTRKRSSRLIGEILETANDMCRSGVIDEAAYHKITLRHGAGETSVAPLNGADIRAIRERANVSQGVFAHYLNLTAGYVSQLERGAKRPTGPTLVLLDLIRRRGLESIL